MYCGRFAPSPTGPLHFGSLIAALASYLEARRHGGQWLLRMEDTDTPRCSAFAADAILRVLFELGFRWDGEVAYQSQRTELYRRELQRLGEFVYPCCCSRKEISESAEGRYPGTCRSGIEAGKPVRALRLRVADEAIEFRDLLQGPYRANLETDPGDFVLLRPGSGIFSYQLAVVVDDQAQGVTHVVRGADLLDSTPRQIYLQQLLGYRRLEYMHIPVATGPGGEKLSKQTLAPALDAGEPQRLLDQALRFLGHEPPEGLRLEALWGWANSNWDAVRIPPGLAHPAP